MDVIELELSCRSSVILLSRSLKEAAFAAAATLALFAEPLLLLADWSVTKKRRVLLLRRCPLTLPRVAAAGEGPLSRNELVRRRSGSSRKFRVDPSRSKMGSGRPAAANTFLALRLRSTFPRSNIGRGLPAAAKTFRSLRLRLTADGRFERPPDRGATFIEVPFSLLVIELPPLVVLLLVLLGVVGAFR